jgi:hypothetical protein
MPRTFDASSIKSFISAMSEQAFKAWFKNSKVVDEGGNPLPVYHGTKRGGFHAFTSENGGMYFTDNKEVAKTYSRNSETSLPLVYRSLDEVETRKNNDEPYLIKFYYNPALSIQDEENFYETGDEFAIAYPGVYPAHGYALYYADQYQHMGRPGDLYKVYTSEQKGGIIRDVNKLRTHKPGLYQTYLSIQKPLVIDAEGSEWDNLNYKGRRSTDEIVALAETEGYDGVIFHDIIDCNRHECQKGNVYVVFKPSQIKSIDNEGTWDENNDHIRADVTFPQSIKATITLLEANTAKRLKYVWPTLNDEQRGNLLVLVMNARGDEVDFDIMTDGTALSSKTGERIPLAEMPDQPIFNSTSIVDAYIPWLANQMKKNPEFMEEDDLFERTLNAFRQIAIWASETKTDLNKLTLKEALDKAEGYQSKAARRAALKEASGDDVKNPRVLTFPDGFFVRELKTKEALQAEGERMNHCVGGEGYCDHVSKGTRRIFSLRDPKNVPKVTIEFDPASQLVNQAKGVANSNPKDYTKYLSELADLLGGQNLAYNKWLMTGLTDNPKAVAEVIAYFPMLIGYYTGKAKYLSELNEDIQWALAETLDDIDGYHKAYSNVTEHLLARPPWGYR